MYFFDLFCGAGGAAVGYYRAGVKNIIGIDKKPQLNYPFHFIQMDVFEFLDNYLPSLDRIYGFHASPPCQAYSNLRYTAEYGDFYPDLIDLTRKRLIKYNKPYIIENIPTAPLINPVTICGASMPGLHVIRHRCFESNINLVGIDCKRTFFGNIVHPPVRSRWNGYHLQGYVTVSGGGNCSVEEAKAAMGIDWMKTKKELNEAIPPAYTEFLGRQLLVLDAQGHRSK